jgi:hypothetical protein
LISGGVTVQPQRLNCKTIQIPTHLRGAVIGTGGAVINKIRAETQSYIQVNNPAPGDPFVSVMITGNVDKVEQLINLKIKEVENDEAWRKNPKKTWVDPSAPKNSWLMQQLQAEGCAPDRASLLLQASSTPGAGIAAPSQPAPIGGSAATLAAMMANWNRPGW